jgi:hypothetical protein
VICGQLIGLGKHAKAGGQVSRQYCGLLSDGLSERVVRLPE